MQKKRKKQENIVNVSLDVAWSYEALSNLILSGKCPLRNTRLFPIAAEGPQIQNCKTPKSDSMAVSAHEKLLQEKDVFV